jgi:predicted nucleotidyltransferase component of viral defense system
MNMKDSPFFKQAQLVLRVLPLMATEPSFALKGGSAINLFVQDLPRLSVDIDLTYLPIEPRNVSLTLMGNALLRIADSLRQALPGIKIQEARYESKYVIRLFVQYQNVQIKIEPNVVIRGAVFPCENRLLVPEAQTKFEMFISIQTLSIADLYGGKLCAALDRQHPRDLFDISILMEHEGISNDIRRAFVLYLGGHPRPINEVLNPKLQDIRKIYHSEFLGLTRVPVSYEKLITTRQEMIDLLKRELTENERLFLLSIKEGQPKWELMEIKGIEKLPAIQWKLFNIRKMNKNKHRAATAKLKAVLEL